MDNIKKEKLELAVLRACQLLTENGLGHWKLKLGNKTNTLANTHHKDKTIVFSKKFIYVATKEQFDGVTLHEASHAIIGPGKGHGEEFIRKCREISPNDDYITEKTSLRLARYILTCPACGYSGQTHTKLEGYCGKCDEKNKISKFKIEKNSIRVTAW